MDYDIVAGVGPNKVLVVGAGKSGLAVAHFCQQRGAQVTVTDKRTGAELHAARAELGERVTWELGRHMQQSFLDADLIVLSPGVPEIEPLRIARKKGVRVTGEIELASSFIQAPLIGVTGTNGKSTVTALAGEMAKRTGKPTFVGGNLGTPLITAVGTPAATLAGLVVVELSSFQLETAEKLHPRAAAFLNLTPDHLDRYQSVEEYGAAKLKLASNLLGDDVAVINADDPFFWAAGERLRKRTRVRTFSARRKRDDNKRPIDGVVDGNELVALGERYPVGELQLVGRHNLGNALAAILLMRGNDLVPYDRVRAALAAFQPLPHRMQLVGRKRALEFYDDSKATNVDSVVAGLDGFPTPFVLIAGGRDKGGSYAPMVAAMRDNRCRAAVLIGEAADKIEAAIRDADDPAYDALAVVRAASMEDAVARAVAAAQPGDAVVLSPACSSYDMFDNYEHRGRAFAAAVEAL
ncbi:MAG: UDP-N-acetylmuramoylalanine--D-glutamate ligase [bacterium]|nr:UDP-N-acetylmuramoylalanine--D-glutamate ligase [bacterium]